MPVYEVRSLTKIYRQGGTAANDDLSFDIEQGEIFGLLGPNGAGKTTLVRQLVGLVKPTRGSIRLFGHDIVRSAAAVPRYVAYLAQKPLAVAEVYVSDAIALTGRIRGLDRREAAARARELMGLFGLEAVARRPIMRLSGGQQRLVTLALALIGDLPVLILDEPTNELDPEHRRLVWDLLLERNRRQGTTVILVTHNVLEAERVIQRVGIINHGRIMALGRVGELKARVDQRVRLELRFAEERGGVPPAGQVEEAAGGQLLELARGHYAVLVDRADLQAAVARILDTFGPARLDDFRIQTPTLEDVYLQLGGERALPTSGAHDARTAETSLPGSARGAAAAAAPPGALRVWWSVFLMRLATLREFWYWQVVGWLLFPLGIVFFFKMALDGEPQGAVYLVGGNVVMGLVITTVQFVATDLAWARQRNDLDFFATLPVSRLQLVLAFVAVAAVASVPAALFNLQAASWLLDLPITWHPALLLLVVLSVLSMAGLAVMIGVTARSGTHANVVCNILMLVVMFLSPVLIPKDQLPALLQYTAVVLPTTYAAHGLRAAVTGGEGLLVDVAVLVAWASVSLWLAVSRLEWRRD